MTGARTLYRDLTLVDGTGSAPVADAAVLVEGGVIAYAGPAAGAPEPRPEDTVESLGGRTLLPGFIDTHVHFGFADGRALAANNSGISRSLHAFESAERMRLTLDAGVTGARDLGGADAGFRIAQERGLIRAPRLSMALRLMSHTGGHADFTLPSGANSHDCEHTAAEIADSPQEVRVATRRLVRDGADVIKVCATGGLSSPSDGPTDEGITEEEIRVIVDETAKHGGRPVAAHAQGAAGIRNAVRGGAASIEHGYLIDDEGIDLMLERGTFLVPTLTTFDFEDRIHLMSQKSIDTKRALADETYERIAHAVSRGVRVAMGTDAGISEHGRNLRELAQLVSVGLSPTQAIVAGTGNAAELLGAADRVGTVEAGKLADLVVCEGDPLADIALLGERANIVLVVQGGEVVKDTRA
ncbi:metal-dependent hydrolase family protein [Nocardiopsis metallicus]|uniref:Imidazolonepropionase-like amidohydrolase n=1 Tax=Nocardiopsis metallicus TaxID=179819 RepID=A0A840WVL7_9ACTN|nr:amidohydrolase family protein [Nocardiopsis metallicus]MBB5495577.1 imidazolonepropionase-like amidohydrolase [Nocardiopsis metallicus]